MPTLAIDLSVSVALTESYIELINRLGAAAGEAVMAEFLRLNHLNREDIPAFADSAGPVLQAARDEAIDLTSGYLAQVTGQVPDVIDLVQLEAEFEAPFLRTWHELSEGATWEQARESGASQADALGQDHVQQGAADRMAQPGVKVRGFRRVLTPGACEWCQVVSTQIYRTAESARFGHHDCKCTVVAVPVGHDSAAEINRQRLADLKSSGAVERVSAARARSRNR